MFTIDREWKTRNIDNQLHRITFVITTEGLKDWEKAKIDKAIVHAERAINSPEFREAILSHTWTERVCRGFLRKKCSTFTHHNFKFSENLAREQVYQSIIEGKEVLGSGLVDYIGQIFLKVDRSRWRKCVGYTYRGTRWQWLCAWVLRDYLIERIAANLAHEYCHKLGYPDKSRAASKGCVTYFVSEFVAKYQSA